MLSEAAPAKVNLFLHVLGRRADGYHMLDSLAVFPGPADVVRATASDVLTLDIVGPFASALPPSSDNLVLRAARALGQGRGARLVLEKNLPVASGIGGGSADAAAALRVLGRLWQMSPGASLAAGLGADVPVCLRSTPTRMGGVGDILGAAPAFPPAALLLVNPGVAVSTAEVFRRRAGPDRVAAQLPVSWPTVADMAYDLASLHNDLEPAAIDLCPPISDALAWLRARPGCLLARMSGSGATCFGLFQQLPAAAPAPASWWLSGGAIG